MVVRTTRSMHTAAPDYTSLLLVWGVHVYIRTTVDWSNSLAELLLSVSEYMYHQTARRPS